MDPNEFFREAFIAMIKEGVEAGFNFLTAKLQKKSDDKPGEESVPVAEAGPAEQPPREQIESEEALPIEWQKAATLFWLGNDLMWIQDQMYRGSSPSRVLQGVENATTYARNLGFDDSSLAVQNLSIVKSILESLPSRADSEDVLRLIQQHYGTVEQYIKQTKFYIQAKAEGQEPGFQKLRAF